MNALGRPVYGYTMLKAAWERGGIVSFSVSPSVPFSLCLSLHSCLSVYVSVCRSLSLLCSLWGFKCVSLSF